MLFHAFIAELPMLDNEYMGARFNVFIVSWEFLVGSYHYE